MKECFYDNTSELISALSKAIRDDLQAELDANSAASMALSGGKTPQVLYEQLSTCDVDWPNVTVTLTDERWVPNDHPKSNERMVHHTLFKNKALSAQFVALKTDHATALAAEAELNTTLSTSLPTVDVVVLGMGEDGHFASLFPNTRELTQGLSHEGTARCIATQGPVFPTERMSLTLSMLLSAKKIYLFITGDTKLHVVRQASASREDDRLITLPITAILQQSDVPVMVYWSP